MRFAWWLVVAAGCGADGDGVITDTGGTEEVIDKDEDGSPKGEDCDDRDEARFPGNPEVCDDLDNDCDEEIDEDPTDGRSVYTDTDNDGVGAGEPIGVACDDGVRLSFSTGDCDDEDGDRTPGAKEDCDGVDNNCDDLVDLNTVPRDFPTIRAAVDAASNGDDICVQAGTYTETVGDVDHSVEIIAASGPDATFIDLVTPSTAWIEVDSENISDVTVTGFTVHLTTATAVVGAFAKVRGGTLELDGVVFDAPTSTANAEGMLIYSTGGTTTLTDVEVRDLSVTLVAGGTARGAFLKGLGGDVVVRGLTFTSPRFTAPPTALTCTLYGGLLSAEVSPLDMDDLVVTDAVIDLPCKTESLVKGGLIRHVNDDLEGTRWTITGSTVDIAGIDATWDGLVFLEEGEGLGIVDDVVLSDNTINVVGVDTAIADGVLRMFGTNAVPIHHLTAHRNTITADAAAADGLARGTVHLSGSPKQLRWLDLRDNTLTSDATASGGGLYSSADLVVENAIIAGNVISAGESASGGGMTIIYSGIGSAFIEITNVDVVGNRAESDDFANGAGIDVALYPIHLTNVSVVDNVLDGVRGSGSAISTDDDLDIQYCNVFGNSGGVTGLPFDGMTDPTGTDGNVSVDPVYVDVTSADPVAWDVELDATSPLIDAGDPDLDDADGTLNDIGAYGGPYSNGW